MKLKRLVLENFRNFEFLEIELNNTNVIFGINDIGKTNLLYSIRFLLDYKVRKNGLIDSDYYNKQIDRKIRIILEIEFGNDEDDEDSKKIITIARPILSEENSIYIVLEANYQKEYNNSEIVMKRGGNLGSLEKIRMSSLFRCDEIDRIFNIIYIDSSIKVTSIFKDHVKSLFENNPLDDNEKQEINNNIDDLNTTISSLNLVKDFEKDINSEYNSFKAENIKFHIQSEIVVNNLYSNLNAYRLDSNAEKYPTSGDGRKKILQYAIQKIEAKEMDESKINIFLIEEIENHLHRSLQKSLSFQLFEEKLFRNMFITTHSSLIVSEMDKVQLIKLYCETKPIGKSKYYIVPDEYKNNKQKFNSSLSEAIFYDEVMLVEGQSEKVLFEYILQKSNPKYECQGKYILSVEGVGFKNYYDILNRLGIKCIVKTDNDIKLYETENKETKGKDQFVELTGINRGLDLIDDKKIKRKPFNKYVENIEGKRKEYQKGIYSEYKDKFLFLEKKNIFLSEIDLENDLYKILPDKLNDWKNDKHNKSNKTAVELLQEAKRNNMVDFCNYLTYEDVEKILSDDNFRCLKRFLE